MLTKEFIKLNSDTIMASNTNYSAKIQVIFHLLQLMIVLSLKLTGMEMFMNHLIVSLVFNSIKARKKKISISRLVKKLMTALI